MSFASGFRLPPGSPGKPLMGNAMQISNPVWETFDRWAKEYGELVQINLFGQSLVIVSSLEIAHDLFEKRSSIYSDRAHSPMFELMGWDYAIAMMGYGDWWRRHRRIFHQYFNPSAAATYNDVLTRKTREFLRRLHEVPAEPIPHLRHLAGSIIMEVTYGITVKTEGDPYIDIAETAISGVGQVAVPGRFLVETFPLLRYVPEWMPGAGFRRKAREWEAPTRELASRPFKAVKDALEAGTAKSSVVATLLEDLSRRTDVPPDEETIIRNVGANIYAGGADTTVSALSTFILAMVLFPEVQRKAQDELDAVVGNHLPDFADLESLPYVAAVCKEIHRWRPVGPAGLGYRVTEDDTYGEYFIPAGSLIMASVWTIFRDEKIYGPNPDAFEPERFLRPEVIDPIGHFGFGRRMCPDRHLADNSIAIAVASILKVFDISLAKDHNGVDIPVNPLYVPALLTHPEPFSCSIKPRSARAEALILQLDETRVV